MAVAVVSRKHDGGLGQQFEVDVDWIAREPRPLWLRSRETALVPRRFPALFLAGSDAFGRADTLLVRDAATTCGQEFDVALEDGTYCIAFDATRRSGRGWHAATFRVEQE
jgi:hypothetical protein